MGSSGVHPGLILTWGQKAAKLCTCVQEQSKMWFFMIFRTFNAIPYYYKWKVSIGTALLLLYSFWIYHSHSQFDIVLFSLASGANSILSWYKQVWSSENSVTVLQLSLIVFLQLTVFNACYWQHRLMSGSSIVIRLTYFKQSALKWEHLICVVISALQNLVHQCETLLTSCWNNNWDTSYLQVCLRMSYRNQKKLIALKHSTHTDCKGLSLLDLFHVEIG